MGVRAHRDWVWRDKRQTDSQTEFIYIFQTSLKVFKINPKIISIYLEDAFRKIYSVCIIFVCITANLLCCCFLSLFLG